MKGIYYRPGLISLVFFSITLIPYLVFQKNKIEKPSYTFRVIIDSEAEIKEFKLNNPQRFNSIQRNCNKIYLKEYSNENNVIISNGINLLKSICKNKDTINGVDFIIKNTYYKDFIAILNEMKKNKVPYYIVLGDTLRGFYEQLPKPEVATKKERYFGGNCVIELSDEVEVNEIRKNEFIKEHTFQINFILAGLVLHVVLSIIRIKNGL